MRHRKTGRKLGRSPSHRLALKRNLARALFEHGRIITTLAKAKEMRPFVEKIITLAKKGTLHARRRLLAKIPDRAIVKKLMEEIGPQFAERPGGYVRIIKREERRLGDGGRTAYLALLGADEPISRERAKVEAPTAPKLSVTEEQAPPDTATDEAPPQEEPTSEQQEQSEATDTAEDEEKPEAPEEKAETEEKSEEDKDKENQ